MKKILIASFLLSVSALSFAWDGSVRAKISQIDIVSGLDASGNYDFRVTLDQTTYGLCGNGHLWAYLNEADANYKTSAAGLMSAKAAGGEVTLYANKQDPNNPASYCHIGYVVLH